MAKRALGRATLQISQAVRSALPPAGSGPAASSPLVVACSGGADSLALAAGTLQATRGGEHDCWAIVVDHGLQPGSAGIADGAAATLRGLGFSQIEVARVTVDHGSQGLEAAARSARYRAFDQLAARTGGSILLGHTLDDQAETVLLGLARGSGNRSLAGMAPSRGPYLRPLLGLRREITVRACAELGLTPWQDPHNTDPSFARVRVRHRALPVLEAELGPGVTEALARTARLVRDDADLLDTMAADFLVSSDAIVGEQRPVEAGATLSVAALLTLHPAVRRRALRQWLVGQGAIQPTLAQVDAVQALVTKWRGQQGVDIEGVRVVRSAGGLYAMAG